MTRAILFSVTKADLTIQHFRSGGSGGQHQNVTDSGTRIIHRASGARGESRQERSQHQNTRNALKRLAAHPLFLWWVNQEVRRLDTGKTAEQHVEEAMHPDNIKLEVRRDGRWEQVDFDDLTDIEADNFADLALKDAAFELDFTEDGIAVRDRTSDAESA